MAVEHAHLVRGREDVGEQDGVRAVHGPRQRVHGQVGKGHADVVGLGAVDQMAEDPAATAPALAVRPLPAVGAAPARGDAGDQYPVTRPHGPDVTADLDDLADGLVAEDRTGAYFRNVALEDVQVRAADGDGSDAHDRVGGILDRWVGDLFPGGLSGAVEHVAFHDVPLPLNGLRGRVRRRDPGATTSLAPTCVGCAPQVQLGPHAGGLHGPVGPLEGPGGGGFVRSPRADSRGPDRPTRQGPFGPSARSPAVL